MDLSIEIVGFAAAVIGLITALINRKRIVVHTVESQEGTPHASTAAQSNEEKPRVTLGKRVKRIFLLLGVALLCVMIAGSFDDSEEDLTGEVHLHSLLF